MPGQDEYEELKGRVVQLEQRLATRSVPTIEDITAEEFRTYIKVRGILQQVIGPGSGCAPGVFGRGDDVGGTGCAPGVFGPGDDTGGTGCAPGVISPGDDTGGSGCAPGGFGAGAVGRFGDLGG
ncbi:hypothetical protein AB0I34_06305 [Kribbella sp. NPDC050281]|uniref:hypothetical protein n=1 Tax=Kribbella sp. NPDC050281 TaxID=3155515 RepID=UPI0033DC9E5D